MGPIDRSVLCSECLMVIMKKPTLSTLIPVISLVAAAWVDRQRSHNTGLVRLTREDGSQIFLRSSSVYAVHPSPYHVDAHILTRVRIVGLGPLDVMESLQEVVSQVGDLVRFHVPGGPLGLSGDVSAYVSASHVTMLQSSSYRMSGSNRAMTDLVFNNGFKFTVVEEPGLASAILDGIR